MVSSLIIKKNNKVEAVVLEKKDVILCWGSGINYGDFFKWYHSHGG